MQSIEYLHIIENMEDVKNLACFIESKFHIGKQIENGKLFYRGQADSSWDLLPSIERGVNEEITPYTNTKAENMFRQLACNQHYKEHCSSGTRLLDFTTDLNIGLFFACSDSLNRDGALFITQYFGPYKESSKQILLMSNLPRIKENEIMSNTFVAQYISELSDKIDDGAALYAVIKSGCMVCPTDDFRNTLNGDEYERIKKQKGAFFIFGNYVSKQGVFGGYKIFKKINTTSSLITDPRWSMKIIIPNALKEEILHWVNDHGITESTLGLPPKQNCDECE